MSAMATPHVTFRFSKPPAPSVTAETGRGHTASHMAAPARSVPMGSGASIISGSSVVASAS